MSEGTVVMDQMMASLSALQAGEGQGSKPMGKLLPGEEGNSPFSLLLKGALGQALPGEDLPEGLPGNWQTGAKGEGLEARLLELLEGIPFQGGDTSGEGLAELQELLEHLELSRELQQLLVGAFGFQEEDLPVRDPPGETSAQMEHLLGQLSEEDLSGKEAASLQENFSAGERAFFLPGPEGAPQMEGLTEKELASLQEALSAAGQEKSGARFLEFFQALEHLLKQLSEEDLSGKEAAFPQENFSAGERAFFLPGQEGAPPVEGLTEKELASLQEALSAAGQEKFGARFLEFFQALEQLLGGAAGKGGEFTGEPKRIGELYQAFQDLRSQLTTLQEALTGKNAELDSLRGFLQEAQTLKEEGKLAELQQKLGLNREEAQQKLTELQEAHRGAREKLAALGEELPPGEGRKLGNPAFLESAGLKERVVFPGLTPEGAAAEGAEGKKEEVSHLREFLAGLRSSKAGEEKPAATEAGKAYENSSFNRFSQLLKGLEGWGEQELSSQPRAQEVQFNRTSALPPEQQQLKHSVLEQLNARLSYFKGTEELPARMRMSLHPPSLGELKVTVSQQGGKLTAEVLAESAAVREALEGSLNELRQRFQQMNLNVEKVEVQSPQDQSAEEGNHYRGSQFQDRQEGNPYGRNYPGEGTFAGENPPEGVESPLEGVASPGGIDIRA